MERSSDFFTKEKKNGVCPFCGSEKLDIAHFQRTDKVVKVEMYCTDCEKFFTKEFDIT